MDSTDTIRCSSVEISTKGLSEFDQQTRIISIPREQIIKITLHYGARAERPIVQVVFGLTLFILGLTIGILPLVHVLSGDNLAREIQDTRPYNFRILAYALALIPTGLWFLLRAMSHGYYLLVKTGKGRKKLFFQKSTKSSEVFEFINKGRTDFGYEIIQEVKQNKRLGSR